MMCSMVKKGLLGVGMSDGEPITLGIVDDHQVVQDGIRLLAERTEGFEFWGASSSAADLLRRLERKPLPADEADQYLVSAKIGVMNAVEGDVSYKREQADWARLTAGDHAQTFVIWGRFPKLATLRCKTDVAAVRWREVWQATSETLVTYGVLVYIIAAAVPFGWVVAVTEGPQKLADFMFGLSQNKFVILFMINVILLIAGCFMETTAILLIATPTLLPIVLKLGIDPVHFGLIMIVNLLIGTLTPPFGVILFIVMDIAQVSFGRIVRAVIPFYIPLAFTLLLITYWADMVMFLPRLFK